MNTELNHQLLDKQSEPDDRNLRIDKVGVRNLRFPIRIRDKAHVHQDTIATIGMYVDLPHHFKGTHMSRFIEVLNVHGNVVDVENIPDILTLMQKRLDSQSAHLELAFPFFLEKPAPVTGKIGLMDYHALFDATANGDEIDFVYEVNLKSHPMPDQSLGKKPMDEMNNLQVTHAPWGHKLRNSEPSCAARGRVSHPKSVHWLHKSH